MTAQGSSSEGLSLLDRPNSYIGKTVPRPNLDRLMQGRGLYVSDMELPRMGHVVFLRSPHAHAKVVAIDTAVAKLKPGAPYLLYLYYALDHRPWWFRSLWRISDMLRRCICAMPFPLKCWISTGIAVFVYSPLARVSRVNLRRRPSSYITLFHALYGSLEPVHHRLTMAAGVQLQIIRLQPHLVWRAP